MRELFPFFNRTGAALACGLVLWAGAARADDHERGPRVPMLPLYVQECGACHIAYAPGLLPAASWKAMMGNLSQHYGSDASLDDPGTAHAISAWLNMNAATRSRMLEPPPEHRISRAAWFVRKHDEVPRAAWSRPSIRSAANCGACHPNAAEGDFEEDDVRIPR